MSRRVGTRAPGVPQLMGWVLLALLPGAAVRSWYLGAGVLWQLAIAIAFALLFEALLLRLRGRPLRPAPWWVAATGMAAALALGKHVYGGLGSNLFNPAMVGYAVVLVCFPLELTRWSAAGETAPGAGEALLRILGLAPSWDALAQATPLALRRELQGSGLSLGEIAQHARSADSRPEAWLAQALGWTLGGVALLWRGVIRWQVPAGVLGALLAVTLPLWLFDPDQYGSPIAHLASGSLVFAAFFVATDPVTGCSTPRGRLIFGAGVALLTLALRQRGAQGDGVAFAVLLMNCVAPWIDLHSRPRYAGESPA
jgi:electron transport complex protein RnfD